MRLAPHSLNPGLVRAPETSQSRTGREQLTACGRGKSYTLTANQGRYNRGSATLYPVLDDTQCKHHCGAYWGERSSAAVPLGMTTSYGHRIRLYEVCELQGVPGLYISSVALAECAPGENSSSARCNQ